MLGHEAFKPRIADVRDIDAHRGGGWGGFRIEGRTGRQQDAAFGSNARQLRVVDMRRQFAPHVKPAARLSDHRQAEPRQAIFRLTGGSFDAPTEPFEMSAIAPAGDQVVDDLFDVARAVGAGDHFEIGEPRNGTIREDGRHIHNMYLFQVKTPAESKAPWDFYKLVETIPAKDAFRPIAEGNCPMVKK